jgi:hypothetical protein
LNLINPFDFVIILFSSFFPPQNNLGLPLIYLKSSVVRLLNNFLLPVLPLEERDLKSIKKKNDFDKSIIENQTFETNILDLFNIQLNSILSSNHNCRIS